MAEKADMSMHRETYQGFLTFVKWGAAATIAGAALVIIVIAN